MGGYKWKTPWQGMLRVIKDTCIAVYVMCLKKGHSNQQDIVVT